MYYLSCIRVRRFSLPCPSEKGRRNDLPMSCKKSCNRDGLGKSGPQPENPPGDVACEQRNIDSVQEGVCFRSASSPSERVIWEFFTCRHRCSRVIGVRIPFSRTALFRMWSTPLPSGEPQPGPGSSRSETGGWTRRRTFRNSSMVKKTAFLTGIFVIPWFEAGSVLRGGFSERLEMEAGWEADTDEGKPRLPQWYFFIEQQVDQYK